jgi:3''-Phosphoadenosine 5''-phosphosulfate (PAPS) 3''-phosphatase
MPMPVPHLEALAAIAEDAGRAIMAVRGSGYTVELKSDDSPLTQADLASHQTIMRGLARHFPRVPVLSEEGADIPFAERARWERLFIVDPLDGTKEFVKELGEFCVCIALAENGYPAYGVVHVPMWGKTYAGGLGLGAFQRQSREDGAGPWQAMRVRQPDPAGLTVLASRSHPDPAIEDYLRDKPVRERITAGSALKFCLVAEGRADPVSALQPHARVGHGGRAGRGRGRGRQRGALCRGCARRAFAGEQGGSFQRAVSGQRPASVTSRCP